MQKKFELCAQLEFKVQLKILLAKTFVLSIKFECNVERVNCINRGSVSFLAMTTTTTLNVFVQP